MLSTWWWNISSIIYWCTSFSAICLRLLFDGVAFVIWCNLSLFCFILFVIWGLFILSLMCNEDVVEVVSLVHLLISLGVFNWNWLVRFIHVIFSCGVLYLYVLLAPKEAFLCSENFISIINIVIFISLCLFDCADFVSIPHAYF